MDGIDAGHAQGVGHLGGRDALGLLLVGAGVVRGIDARARNADDRLDGDDLVELGEGVDLGVIDGQGHAVPQGLVLRGDPGVDAGVLDRVDEVGLLGLDRGPGTALGDGGGGQLSEPVILDRGDGGAIGLGQPGGDLRGRIAGDGLGLVGGGGRDRGDECSEDQGRGAGRDDTAQ